jgi:AcrR family transcriptional regulator
MTRGEARERLLRAGRSTFAERGYARSSTRDIADSAGVSEALLYRHFGSKVRLFEQAVLEPFERLVDTYIEGRSRDLPGRGEIEWLYDLLCEHRELIMALLAAQAYEIDLSDTPELSAAVDRLQSVVDVELVTTPALFAMVFALAVFENWLLPRQPRPSRERIIEEVVRFTAHGLVRHGRADNEPPIGWRNNGEEAER